MRVSQAVESLVAELGAQVQVNLRPFSALTSKELTIARARVNARVGVEFEFSDESSNLAVVWDRPTPYRDRARVLLRGLLQVGGFDDSGVSHLWAVPVGLGNRAPTLQETRDYSPTLREAIAATGSKYVLIVGKSATSSWRERLDFGWVTNHMYVMDSRWFVYPVFSPVAVMMDPMLNHEWRMGIQQFCELVHMDSGLDALADRCSKKGCKNDLFMFDPDGVGWCVEHAEEGMRERKNERVARNKNKNKQQQEGML